MMMTANYKQVLRVAYHEVKAGLGASCYPICSVSGRNGSVISQRRNQHIQRDDPIAHDLMETLCRAGWQKPYRTEEMPARWAEDTAP